MSLAARSPSSRKSLSAFDTNIDNNMAMFVSAQDNKAKKRAVASIGGEGLRGVGFGANEAIIKGNPRNLLQPRKSILKSFSNPSLARQEEYETVDYTQQYAHTVAFGSLSNENTHPSSRTSRQSLGGRRVSFAPNAHVRMFEPQVTKIPRSSVNFSFTETPAASTNTSHSRRSSIQNIGSVSKPNIFAPRLFQGEGEALGEESMEIEEEDDDTYGIQMGVRSEHDQGYDDDAEGEETMEMEDDMDIEDMDVTTHVYGGIVRRASMAPAIELDAGADTEDEDDDGHDESQNGDDEEKTMDFTIATGGFLPPKAPAEATRNRSSIGYSFPNPFGENVGNLLPGDDIEGEEYAMEETQVYGQIIGQDVSFSSGSEDTVGSRGEKTMTFSFNQSIPSWNPNAESNRRDVDDDGMDMVTAVGGIINFPAVSPGRTSLSAVHNTRPMSGTPSFARPTVSSARKSIGSTSTVKRNVFAPSPSPVTSTTPQKSGMQTAAEVAKRLSFGSATSSGSKKRAREESQERDVSPVKKSRVEVAAEEVFGINHKSDEAQTEEQPSSDEPQSQSQESTTPLSDPFVGQILSARRSSLGTAMRLSLPRQPQRESEIEENVIGTQSEEPQEHDVPQNISLSAFLEMTGVQFMEELPGMLRKKSTISRSVLGQSFAGERDFALHDYTEAQVNSVFLNMYTWATDKIRDNLQSGDEELAAVAARCDVDSPSVIQEYLSASDEDKQLFEMTFKSYKTTTHLKAREMWYDWKSQLIETIRPDVQAMLEGMQDDNARLTSITEQTSNLLPQLRARQAELQAELKKERESVTEVAACDQGELAAYREAIAEQGAQINNFSTELAESKAKLLTLTTKLQDLNEKKHGCDVAISHAKSQCDQYTRSDAIRLQEELVSLQQLHLWRPAKFLPQSLRLTYDSEISLSFSCRNYLPDISSAKLEYIEERMKGSKRTNAGIKGDSPTLSLFEVVKAVVSDMSQSTQWDLSSFVQRTGLLWSKAQRLRAELRYLSLHHPISISLSSATPNMQVTASVMVRKKKSKVLVEFDVGQNVMLGFPRSLSGVDVTVKGIYGPADVGQLDQIAKQTIQCSRPEACLGTFLQVCVEVRERYAHP